MCVPAEVRAQHGVDFLPAIGTDITACSLKSGSELMQDPSPLYGATCLEVWRAAVPPLETLWEL